MGTECSPNEPLLLSSKEDDHNAFDFKKITLLSVKFFLKFTMWLIFIAWASLIFLLPSEFGSKLNEKLIHATSGTLFGTAGSFFLIFSGPLLIIAFVAVIYIGIFGEEEVQMRKNKPKNASFRLWTFPVIIDGPFGVVTAAELIGIVLFSIYIIWAIVGYTIKNYSLLSLFDVSDEAKSYLFLELTGLRFGFIGLICMAFLFLPVARGSVLLRLIDIPFEHAARYHVWLGHLTMVLFTLHGLFYVFVWFMEGRLIHELFDWKSVGIANLPGVISLLAGLLMWVTSLPPVRRRINFELFFYTHQLYVVFVVFLAMHVGDFIFSIVAAGIFLFMLDRFLRFFQSRKTVNILSAKCLPSGTVELVISKPQNLQYNALSWVFLQIRELSWLQWHPFSVSSSPLDGKHHLAVLIKVLGDWTEKLRGHILSEQGDADGLMQPNLKLKAYVEGPYGHESPYHLTYEHLILVAGGIGISPFLAILSDILHRIRDDAPCLPRNILIVWAIKNSDELPLLHSLDIESICPYFYNKINLETQTYVTRESEPPLEEGKVQKHVSSCVFSTPNKCDNGMSSLVGTGNIGWSGAYVIVPTIGFVVIVALLYAFYINPYDISYWWYKGLLLFICMAASVLLFGGFVIGLWHLWDLKTSAPEISEDPKKIDGFEQLNEYNASKGSYVNTIKYGQRPDFKEIFGRMGEQWGNVDIGVMVCGPTTLQTTIAKECRSMNFKRSSSNEPIFHFNSHTFDL